MNELQALKTQSLKDWKGSYSEAIAWAQKFKHKPVKGYWLISQNAKLEKGEEYYSVGLELASGKRAGHEVCSYALKNKLSCLWSCIVTTGNGRFKQVLECRKRRTRMLFDNPKYFMSLLFHDLKLAECKADLLSLPLTIRLNVYSDIPWYDLVPSLFKEIKAQFYDYTKEPKNLEENTIENYHITLSFNETISMDEVDDLLDLGINIAMVFQNSVPETFRGHKVYNGDENDYTFLKPEGALIGLKAKGAAKHSLKHKDKLKKASGFFIATQEA